MGLEPILFDVTGRCFNLIKLYFLFKTKLKTFNYQKRDSNPYLKLEPKPSMSTNSIILAKTKKQKNKTNENHPTNKLQQTKITKQHPQNANTKPQTQNQNDELK